MIAITLVKQNPNKQKTLVEGCVERLIYDKAIYITPVRRIKLVFSPVQKYVLISRRTVAQHRAATNHYEMEEYKFPHGELICRMLDIFMSFL